MSEKKPIITVFFAKPKEAWYNLSADEQKELIQKSRQFFFGVGGKHVLLCDCRWSNEEWSHFGVEEYPNIEALQKYTKFQEEEIGSYRYFESKTYLGTDAGSSLDLIERIEKKGSIDRSH